MRLPIIAARSLAAIVAAAIVAAGSMPATAAQAATGPPGWQVGYAAHVQNIGWQPEVYDNATAGTVGQSLRMEALTVGLNSQQLPGASVCYRAHVQNVGWQQQVCNGAIAGTTGQSLRMEAVAIQLVNAPGWGVCYTAHVQNVGWQPEACDGAVAGTTGQSLQMEAIRIRLYHRTTTVALNATVGPQYNQGAWHLQTSATLYEDRDAVTGAHLRAYLRATTHASVDRFDPFGFHGTSWITLGPAYFQTPTQATGAGGFGGSNYIPWSADVPVSIADQTGAIYTSSTF